MRNFKKILGIAAAGISATLAMPALGCQGCMAVTVPSNQAAYSFGITGLYARATDRNLLYANGFSPSVDNSSKVIYSNTRNYLSPCFDFGYRLDAAYLISESGNDISVNWTYHSSEDHASVGRLGQVTKYYGAFGDVTLSSLVKGETCYRFQELNIDFGQKVDFCRAHSRLYFGFQYASVSQYIVATEFSEFIPAIPKKLESDFWGIGPHVGFDLSIPLLSRCSRFALAGHISSALLYSDICAKYIEPITHHVGNQSIDQGDIRTITPTTTMKLGLAYSSSHDPAVGGFGVELGWQSSCYYQVVHRVKSTLNRQEFSNAGFEGAYLNLRYAV